MMKNGIKIILLTSLILSSYVGCSGKGKNDDDELDEITEVTPESDSSNDDLSLLDSNDSFENSTENSTEKTTEKTTENSTENAAEIVTEKLDEPVAEQPQKQEEIAKSLVAPPPETPILLVQKATIPEPIVIQSIKFKPNEVGGTIIIEANGPIKYSVRSNKSSRQFIVEVENSVLPEKLKRSLNTKDIEGVFGAIDSYQSPGSQKARFVMQLREGSFEPAVQVEGNTLLVVASSSTVSVPDSQASEQQMIQQGTGILTGKSIGEFMADNTQFYGKKISIEMDDLDVRDALRFITDESGLNMIVAEDVKGKINLKLKQVPWDQALVLLLKNNKLGYTRQGNVLRIARLEDLRVEEEAARRILESNRAVEPLSVRVFPMSYAKADELSAKIQPFLSPRGKLLTESRTNALIITDIVETLDNVAKLISSFDVQPPQVLIEGKIVEASESFARSIGVNWNVTGLTTKLTSTSKGPLNLTPSASFSPAAGTTGAFGLNLNLGTLDLLGNLNATLTLNEREDRVKVISSPRILALSNEKAFITQKTQEPVATVTVTNGVSQTTFSFKDIAIKLEVTPQVTAESSVILDMDVMREFKGANVGGSSGDSFPVNSRQAKTKVLVRNGQTAVIGGIYKSDSQEGQHGVPWFKDLPIIGGLFRGKSHNQDKSELIIFLTPRIISQLGSDQVEEPVLAK